jgi:hypothetical protein
MMSAATHSEAGNLSLTNKPSARPHNFLDQRYGSQSPSPNPAGSGMFIDEIPNII